jgi:hypothetical protein
MAQRREPDHVAGLEANIPIFKDKSRKLRAMQQSPNSDPKNHPGRLKIHLAIYRPSLHVRAYHFSGRKVLLGKSGMKDKVIKTLPGGALSMRGNPQSGL